MRIDFFFIWSNNFVFSMLLPFPLMSRYLMELIMHLPSNHTVPSEGDRWGGGCIKCVWPASVPPHSHKHTFLLPLHIRTYITCSHLMESQEKTASLISLWYAATPPSTPKAVLHLQCNRDTGALICELVWSEPQMREVRYKEPNISWHSIYTCNCVVNLALNEVKPISGSG